MALPTISAMDPRAHAARRRDNPLTRSAVGVVGLVVLGLIMLVCVGTLPWTLGHAAEPGMAYLGAARPASVRYDAQARLAERLPPSWWWKTRAVDRRQAELAAADIALRRIADEQNLSPEAAKTAGIAPTPEQVAAARPWFWMGTDALGRDMLVRCLMGGAISLGIGLAAAVISVFIGTVYGAIAGYAGGRVDGVMMRIVDVFYGLPYVLLVVLLAVAGDAYLSARSQSAGGLSGSERAIDEIAILLVAIGGVSWLTMARVVRGQVLSLKAQPFMEAARAIGVPPWRQIVRHLLPNLAGPIIVYATLTVPQAILQESFLSFLGIGVRPPVPSWGSLAAEGLAELNAVHSRWWLLVFPCVLLAVTLLALNFVGEALREAMDPRRAR